MVHTLPENYAPKIEAVPANFNGKSNDHASVTVFPVVPQGPFTSDVLFPDGHSHCLLYPSARQQIVATHGGYPQPIKRPPNGIVRHRVGLSRFGLGLFATQDLKQGDLIFSERALFILLEGATRSIPAYFTKTQAVLAALKQWEMELESMFGRLMREDKEAYMALWNVHEDEEGMGPLVGRWTTNGFGLSELVDVTREKYSGIFKVASRFKHSCCPNVGDTWNRLTFTKEFRATRNIKKGEELTVSYVPVMWPQHQRQTVIDEAGYGFRCACRSCCSGAKKQEMIKKNGKPKWWFLIVALMSMAADDEGQGDWVVERSESVEMIKTIEREGFELASQYEAHLAFLVEVFCAMGNTRKGVVWLRKLDAIRREQRGERRSL
ncbi:hypothetical protein V5O48_015536 [Marasmius crinis-equi]|uniref:SET domain-containing protein n=1 Tax=Marasmius crinis-equi TaxID=585013 RepID=A0ABR3EU88_9AGAR